MSIPDIRKGFPSLAGTETESHRCCAIGPPKARVNHRSTHLTHIRSTEHAAPWSVRQYRCSTLTQQTPTKAQTTLGADLFGPQEAQRSGDGNAQQTTISKTPAPHRASPFFSAAFFQRQLDASQRGDGAKVSFDPGEWSRNACFLADYYSGLERFSEAGRCLLAAQVGWLGGWVDDSAEEHVMPSIRVRMPAFRSIAGEVAQASPVLYRDHRTVNIFCLCCP